MTKEEIEALAELEGMQAPADAPTPEHADEAQPVAEPVPTLSADQENALCALLRRKRSVADAARDIGASPAAVERYIKARRRRRTDADACADINQELRRTTRHDDRAVDSLGFAGRRRIW